MLTTHSLALGSLLLTWLLTYSGGLSPAVAALGLLAVAALAGRQWAARTAQLFEFKDYDHAHPSKR